jgi:hypothetical protein
MAIRRLMMMGLTNYINSLIREFKITVGLNKGHFESEECLYQKLTDLNLKNILGEASLILTPNAYNENILHKVRSVPIITPFYNLVQYTESSIGWVGSQAVLSTTTELNPFGALNAILLRESATTNVHLGARPGELVIISGRTYTFSIYLKKGSGAGAPDIMQYYTLNGFATNYANFDINLGTVTATSGCTAAISSAPNGWWRCSITVAATSTVYNNQTRLVFCNNNPTAALTPSYAGATNRDVFFIGIQTEESSSVTAYQPVVTSRLIERGYAELLRTSTAYRTTSSGYLSEVPEQNLIYSSDNLTGPLANWGLVNNSLSAFVETAPDGTLTATKVTRTGASNRVQLLSGTYGPISSLNDYVFSIYAKTSEGTTITLANSSSFSNPAARFNLLTGTIEFSTGCTSTIEDAGNGWWRCAVYFTSINLNNVMFNHNSNISEGIFVWGTQVVLGTALTDYYLTISRRATARIDYDDSCPSILIEEFSSNFLLRSEEFENASWIKSNISVTQNTGFGPNNLLEADTLAATASDAVIKQNGQIFSNNNPRDFSVYIKRKTGTGNIIVENGVNTSTYSLGTSDWIRAFVRGSIISGTYVSSGTTYTITTSTPHGLDTGDAIRFDATSGTAGDQNIASVTVSNPTQFTFTGASNTSSGNCNIIAHNGRIRIVDSGDEIYAWGAQLSQTLLFTNTVNNVYGYIPTTTTTVSTARENINLKSGISTDYTLYGKIKRIGGSNNANVQFLSLSETPNTITPYTNAIGLYGVSTGLLVTNNRVSSVTNANTLAYQPNENNYFTYIITISGSSIDVWLDGSKIISYTNANTNLFNYIAIGGNPILRIKEIYAWQRKLSDLEISFLNEYPYFNSGYSPINVELQQIINRANAEGFTIPGISTLAYCDTLITEMKNENVWNVIDIYFNFAYNDASLQDFSRINWKNAYGSLGLATLFGGLTYQVDGFKGNGVDAHISTNFNPSTKNSNYVLDNAGRFLVVSIENTSTFWQGDGVEGSSNNRMLLSGGNAFAINSGNSNVTITASGTGLKGIMRYASNDVLAINKDVTVSGANTSTDLRNAPQLILRSFNNYGDACISNYYMGASLTNTQIQNFRTYYNTYLSNIGLTPFA